MEARKFLLIIFLNYLTVYGNPISITDSNNDENLLLDCQHSDYRTYIKCLKRQKRHHLHEDADHKDLEHRCMETCLKNCGNIVSNECDRTCTYCHRKKKHRHQIITEYEMDCGDDACGPNTEKPSARPNDPLSTTNITTNIDINNVINTATQEHNKTNCTPPYCGTFVNNPLQLTLVPQITLGLGISSALGCNYPAPWPCVQSPQYPNVNPRIDCSGCGNPMVYHNFRCDVNCWGINSNVPPIPPIQDNLCKSPNCIGGQT